MRIERNQLDPRIAAIWESRMPAEHEPPEQYGTDKGHTILKGFEDIGIIGAGVENRRWHLSVAHPKRLPEWGEMVEVAHALRPGVVFVLGIPPKEWWMNYHEFCLHLWQMDDAPLEALWREERKGHTPS